MIPVVVVCGPTASGKTKTAIEICKRFDGEVISADSMQVYKGMDIGTAKPDLKEMEGIPHHLMSVIEPNARFNVSDYCDLAKSAAMDINSRQKLPVVAGGTGLYIDSLIDNIKFFDIPNDFEYRKSLEQTARQEGSRVLWEKLNTIDPDEAQNISQNDAKRIIRALEIYRTTGQTKTYFKKLSRIEPTNFLPLYIGLRFSERKILYDRIHKRVDIMVENGLLEEVKALLEIPGFENSTGYFAIGYKEMIDYLKNSVSFDEAVYNIKLATTRYAKRQMTWFLKNKRINWINIDEYDDFDMVVGACLKLVEGFLKCS